MSVIQNIHIGEFIAYLSLNNQAKKEKGLQKHMFKENLILSCVLQILE